MWAGERRREAAQMILKSINRSRLRMGVLSECIRPLTTRGTNDGQRHTDKTERQTDRQPHS